METKTKKSIILKRLILKNFKGLRDFVAEFDDKVTNIYGDNATGKTTINDAPRWLFFDKDSTDRTQFSIKTLDENNEPIHGLEHSVTGVYEINGQKKTFQKVLKEKWTKKRGESEATFTGHETLYYIDEVPLKAGEFQKEISDILDETIFKLITDPLYFSTKYPWEKRRETLLAIIGDLKDEEVIGSNNELEKLRPMLAEKDIEKLKASIASKRKKYNDDIKQIPPRIDECNNSIKDIDLNLLKSSLAQKEKQLSIIEDSLTDLSKPDPATEGKKEELKKLRAEINTIENEALDTHSAGLKNLQDVLRKRKNAKSNIEGLISDCNDSIKRYRNEVEKAQPAIGKCRTDWDNEKAKEFSISEDFICPTCKRALDADVVDKKKTEMEESFNKAKAEKLAIINDTGLKLKALIGTSEANIKTSEEKRHEYGQQLTELIADVEETETAIRQYNESPVVYPEKLDVLKSEVEKLSKEISFVKDTKEEAESLKIEKKSLTDEIDSIKSQLHQDDTNKKMLARIEELRAEEKKLAQLIADIEKIQFMCESFTKTKVELLESKINSTFKYVRFKLFDVQINGGIKDVCEPLVNGVPFSDANNAAKHNAGIDIINALSNYYGVAAPIFIDNREGINEIIPTDAQIINLIVTKDKILKVA